MPREDIELGLKDAIIEALLDLVGQPMTDAVVQQIAERSEGAKGKFAIDNDLEVEVVRDGSRDEDWLVSTTTLSRRAMASPHRLEVMDVNKRGSRRQSAF